MKREAFIFIVFVFLAFIFWGAISLSEEYLITIHVPVRIIPPEKDFAVEGNLPDKLEIRIKAPGWSLLKIKYFQENDFTLRIKEPVENFVYRTENITNDLLGFPSDVKIVSVQPELIRLNFNLASEKRIKIYPRLNYSLKEGFAIVSPINLQPESILIRGSRKLLANIDSLPTEIIELKELSEPVTVESRVIDTLSNLLAYEKIPVRISLDVQQVVDKDFEKVTIDLINVPKGKDVILLPSFVDLKLRGGINVLGNLQSDSIKVYIDFKKYSEMDEEEIKPEFYLPYGVKVVDYFPKKFKLIIRK